MTGSSRCMGLSFPRRSSLEPFRFQIIVDRNRNGYNLGVPASPIQPIRMTRQRRSLEAALASADGFRSAQDLHAALRTAGAPIGLATVYSQLRQMADAGQVDVIRSDAGESLYRACGGGEHHHHLRCRSCGRVDELHAPAVEAWATEVATQSGFRELSHTLEVTGICPACADG